MLCYFVLKPHERCDICGIAALESDQFTQEALPFARMIAFVPTKQTVFRSQLMQAGFTGP